MWYIYVMSWSFRWNVTSFYCYECDRLIMCYETLKIITRIERRGWREKRDVFCYSSWFTIRLRVSYIYREIQWLGKQTQ